MALKELDSIEEPLPGAAGQVYIEKLLHDTCLLL